jgi:uncharacterized protein YebE (UPF0316 family)
MIELVAAILGEVSLSAAEATQAADASVETVRAIGGDAKAAPNGGMAWWLPILIFLARIVDVSIGTMRMILVINGHRFIAAGLGFVEVVVWVLAVGGVIAFLTNPLALLAYGLGFAVGTLVGMVLEEKIALGYRMIRVVNRDPTKQLASGLRERGYMVTQVPGEGRDGAVEIAFLGVKRRCLRRALADIEEIAPRSFVTIERSDRAEAANDPRLRRIGVMRWKQFMLVRK